MKPESSPNTKSNLFTHSRSLSTYPKRLSLLSNCVNLKLATTLQLVNKTYNWLTNYGQVSIVGILTENNLSSFTSSQAKT